jgi:hypothetical protein
MKIANLMSTAFIFSSAVWLMGTVVLGIHGRLLSDVQTKNEGKWLKVLFVVCGGSLLTLVLSAASWLVAVISITTSRILIAGDADVAITNHLISEIIISGFVAVIIVALLAAFVITVYEKLGEERPWTAALICVAACSFTVIVCW